MALAVALLGGCGSTDTGGSGGSSGSGGTGGGTTSATLPTCTDSGVHVRATLVKLGGEPTNVGDLDITGTVAAAGVDTPPSSECGAGEAWVSIDAADGSGQWLACFQMPNFAMTLVAGDAVELSQLVQPHDIDPPSFHTTLRASGQLVIHVERASSESDVALPESIDIAPGEVLCETFPDDGGCGVKTREVTVSLGAESVLLTPGESGVVGGYRVLVDIYDKHTDGGGCDSGDASVLIGIVPAPAE